MNKCEYVFNVSSILVCPKYLATTWILAPLFINSDSQECLKSCSLICLTPTFSQLVFLRSARALLLIGNASQKFNQDIKAISESNNFVLAPNQKISSWFDFKEYSEQKFDVEIVYETLGKKYVEKYTINLDFVNNIDWLVKYSIDDMSKDYKQSLYTLNNSIQDLTDKFK